MCVYVCARVNFEIFFGNKSVHCSEDHTNANALSELNT